MQWFSRNTWQQLAAGTIHTLPRIDVSRPPKIIFPGAFNPLHEGHTRMAEYAAKALGDDACFELSIKNVDKQPLEYADVARRLTQFVTQQIVLTTAATFVEKAKLFPGATFLVGVDTLLRIGDGRYYSGSCDAMLRAVATIATAGCRFLVFGRAIDGEFQTLSNLTIPPELAALCQPVAEQDFRQDVSSTDLREPR